MKIIKLLKPFCLVALGIVISGFWKLAFAAEKSLGGTLGGKTQYTEDINSTNIADKTANFISNMIGFLTTIAGLYFLFYFLFGAIGWITAGGEPQKLSLAKDKMINAAIGLCIVIASYSVIMIISQVLGIDFLDIQGTLDKIKNP